MGALGAEIHGVDLSQPLSAAIVGQIRRALLDHSVVFFRGQNLTPTALLTFGRRFGNPTKYPFVEGLAATPEVIEVVKLPHESRNFGGIWHTDTAYLDEPPMGSILVAVEVPPAGGDTMFADMYKAYDALSDCMKGMLAKLKAVNSSTKADVTRTREDRIASNPTPDSRRVFEATHPVVRTHPETGRKSLYINIGHTVRFDGMSEEESAPLLNFLFHHQIQPEFTSRFRWEVGSVAFWDNRCTLHYPLNDYHGYTRRMLRMTLAGERPQ